MTGFYAFSQENFTGYLELSFAINYKVKEILIHIIL